MGDLPKTSRLCLTNSRDDINSVVKEINLRIDSIYRTLKAEVTSNTTIDGLNIVRAKTSNYTVLITDQDNTFTNTGASGEVDFTLPSATSIGSSFSFAVEVAQTLKIIAIGTNVLRIGTSQSAAGGNLSSNSIGSSLLLRCTETGVWSTVGGAAGSWTVT